MKEITSEQRAIPHKWLLPVLLFAITIASYIPVFQNGFVYDDHFQLERNPYIRDFRYVGVLLTTDVWHFSPGTKSNNYRPVHMISYLFLYKLFGLNPLFYHAAALLLYVLSVLLLWGIFLEYSGTLPSFVACLLWATHPVHVESVAWVGGFPDLLCGLFLFASFLLYRKNLTIPSLIFFLLALFSKETALVFPLVVFADHALFRRTGTGKGIFVVWSCGAALLIAGYAFLRVLALGSFLRVNDSTIDLFSIFYSAVAFAGMYLAKLLFPLGLNAFYHFTLPLSLKVSWAGLLLVLCALSLLYAFHKNKLFVFGMLWFFIFLSPALFLADVSPVLFAERYVYLPSAGFLIALLSFAWKRSVVFALVFLSVVFGAITYTRSSVWRDDFTLWQDTVEKSPESPTVNYNMGTAYLKQKDFVNAADCYRRTVTLDPKLADAYYNLALCEYNLGQKDRAAANLAKFLEYARPDHPMRKQAELRLKQLS